jgi:hypothetical protein
MEIEHLIRYAPRAVGLKPSAIRGEARLRGLYRNNSSKTISHFCTYDHLDKTKTPCAAPGMPMLTCSTTLTTTLATSTLSCAT